MKNFGPIIIKIKSIHGIIKTSLQIIQKFPTEYSKFTSSLHVHVERNIIITILIMLQLTGYILAVVDSSNNDKC